ncbi:N-acetylmuramoyl-L-alanine amidase [Fulvimonas soli]|jgi:N-acetylmuramoyl-L-alanine amidase|uniref:N-acetylmuramoyl-L-alanine amidase AmiC n=1 Tax=Fulvimonas soli TaxID=155197 RepID=A0A316IJ75_9GAMM|nr:N-acetylmuramoyl-L-alanine amidase [Fulvimonas soli]PWK92806.1 N-acetylmuramoyl-L-alanine amidase [Fulvimonas soli]TNY28079.1 N-acetylmuramoyl-L-alanine amidase [Fulvimonas soli]
MGGSLTRWGILGLAALAAATPLRAPQAAEVKAARVWAGPEYTRVVFDLSGPLDYKLSRQGDRVVLELASSRLAGAFGAPAATGLFKGLSSARAGGALRLAAQAAPDSRPRSFLLKPAGDYGYRLVLDLYPGKASAPPPARAAGSAAATADASAPDAVKDDPAPVMAALRSARNGTLTTRQAALLLKGDRKVVVAIDAGHGGEDPGAHGPGGTLEKNVTLAVARALAAEINKQPGMQAVLTRDGDYFIPLKRRYQIAREKNADMFVSIHADAFTSGDARGSSVWVLSPRGKTSEAARWLADRENSADLIGGVSLDDKDDSLAAVLLDMQQGYAMQASEAIAGNVLRALGQLGPTHRGYVERANFVVLRSPDVPSILVETAFISNPAEERKLRDPAHQRELAQAVMGGVRSYFESTPPPGTWFAAQAARRSGLLAVADAARDDDRAAPAGTAPDRPSRPARQTGAVASASAASRADDGVRDLHRVGRGESLRSIARQYGVSVGALKNANNMQNDTVRVGAVLAIPAG